MSGFAVERSGCRGNGGDFLGRNVRRQAGRNRALKLRFRFRGRAALTAQNRGQGRQPFRWGFRLRGLAFAFGPGMVRRFFQPVSLSPNRPPSTAAQDLGEASRFLGLRGSHNLVFQLGQRGKKFGGFERLDDERVSSTRRASSGLKGSSLPTVSNTGMRAVSASSLTRWQTSRPP